MSEIKFRAWDKVDKVMKNWNDIIIDKADGDDYYLLGYKENKVITSFDHEQVLMQSTNLFDENEVEIYAGDIVKINNKLYTIQNDIGSMMFVRVSEDTDMYGEFVNCWNDDVYPMSQYYWENDCEEDLLSGCEVIGNICENKELLND